MAKRKLPNTCYNQCIVSSTPPSYSRQCQACSQGRSGWKEAQPFEKNARTKWLDFWFKKFHGAIALRKKRSFITPRPPGRALQIARGRERVDGVWGAKAIIVIYYLNMYWPLMFNFFDRIVSIFTTCAVPIPWRRVALRESQQAQVLQVSPSPSRPQLCRSCGGI